MIYLCGFLLLLASWLQPLHFLPWVSWHSEILAFLATLLLAWSAVVRLVDKSTNSSISFPVAGLPLLGLGVLIGVQWMVGLLPFAGDVFVYWAYLLLCAVSMWFGYSSARARPEMVADLASVILITALASGAIALLQCFELSGNIGWIHGTPILSRPGANLGQPNQLATLLLMGLASAMYIYESRKLGAIPVTFMVTLLMVCLAATESRSGVLGYIGLNCWWFIKRKAIGSQLRLWAVALVGITFVVLYLHWPTLVAEVFLMSGGSPAENTVAYNRWIIWPQLVQAVLLRPWFGWGLGQVSAAHNAVVGAYPVSEAYTYAHNILLDVALGVGLPIAFLLVIAVGVWIWRTSRAIQQMAPWYCMAVVIPVAIHSMVEFSFAYAYFLVPVMLALGTVECHLGGKPLLRIGVKPVALGLLMSAGLLVWSSVEYLAIEEDFRMVRFEALRIGQTPQNYVRPKVYLLTQLDALLYGGRIVPKPNMPVQEMELSRAVALRYPWVATQNRYALSLALNGKTEEAIYQLRVMRAQHGYKTYAKIKTAWVVLANEKYPQLNAIEMP